MNCKKCGAPLDSNSSFCGMCGTPIEPQVNETPEIFDIQEPLNQNTVIMDPIKNDEIIEPIQPTVEPMPQMTQPNPQIVEPVQPTLEPQMQQPTIEPQMQQPTLEPINMNNGSIPPIETPSFEPSQEEEKKHSKLPKILIILIILILLGAGAFYAYNFIFNKPDKVVKGLINKAYEKFESPLKQSKAIDLNNESVLVTTDISLNTNIAGFEDLNDIKLNLITGTDYANKKFELGASLIENNQNIIDLFMYILNKDAYMMLNDIYSSPIKLNTEDIDLEEILNNRISAEDTEYILKELKNIFIESLDMNDFKKSSDTITIDGKEVKVNKINYILDAEKQQKIVNNMIDNILKNEELLNRLAKISNEDVETIKQALMESKIESYDTEDNENIIFNIYTKGMTDEFVGLDIELPENSNIKIRKNSSDTTVSANISGVSIMLTIKEESKEKATIDMKINIAGEEITGTATIENNEIDEKNSESKTTLNITYQGETVELTFNMKQQIGANIAEIDTTNAKAMEEITEEEMNQIEQKLMEKLMNSKLYNLINGQMEQSLYGIEDNVYEEQYIENENI